jgi:hypothetical protein
MVTGTPPDGRWPADVASLVAGVAAPAIVLAVAEVVTVVTLLLLAAWLVVPLHAGGRLLADVRHGLACWSAARLGARHAIDLRERTNRHIATKVTQTHNHTR